MTVPIFVAGQAVVSVPANVRQGTPSIQAPVVRKLQPGATVTVAAVVAGETVQGNSLWFQLDGAGYLWSGACGPLMTGGGSGGGSVVPAPPLPVPAPSTPYRRTVPIVVDIYHGDRVTSFAQAQAAGLRGVIHKATTGAKGRDNLYDDRRTAATDAGLLWGAYHWGTAQPAEQQVDNLLSWADPDENTLIALDFEKDSGSQMTLDRAREVLELIEAKLGRKAVIYSGNTIKEALGDRVDAYFGAHRLWLAQYGPTPRVQRSWKRWWLWQYAERVADLPGIPGNAEGKLDLDEFLGSEEELARTWAS